MTVMPDPRQPSALDRLYFGRDDAESDAGETGLLRAGFLPTKAYGMAMSGRKQLLIGRKGAGKSAICVMLAEAMQSMSSIVTPDEISAEEIRQFELRGVTRQVAKQLIWRYVLSVQTSKLVVSHARAAHQGASRPSVDMIRRFLLNNGELTEDPRWHDKFWQSIQRLRSNLSLEAFGVKATFELGKDSGTALEGVRVAGQLDIIESSLARAVNDLNCSTEHGPFLVLVDKLENIWSNDSDSDELIAGLLSAAKHLPSHVPSVRCVVCIRSDIYDLLQFPDRDKFRGDEIRINWSAAALIDLLVARAQVSTEVPVSVERLFGEYFEGQVDLQLTEDFLVARTLMRPRDLIQFANLCRDTAAKNGHERVTQADMLEAERQYSVWKVQDLASEYLASYPFLNELFVLFQSSGYIVSTRVLEQRVQKLAEMLRRRYRRFADMFTTSGVVALLYGIGFLGVRRGDVFEYVYDGNQPVSEADEELCVHPCFRQALRTVVADDAFQFAPFTFAGTRASWLGPGEIAFRGSHSQLIFDAIEDACRRTERVLVTASLMPELRVDLLSRIRDILSDTREKRDEAIDLDDSLAHGYEVVRLLRRMSVSLADVAGGDRELVWTANRIARISYTLEDEMDGLFPRQPRPSELSP